MKAIFLSSRISFDSQKQEEDPPKLFNNTMESTKKTFGMTTESARTSKPMSIQNIFEEINNEGRKNYVDRNIGPHYDAEGNIVRWSLLGKAEQFQRIQKLKKVQIKTKRQNVDNSFDDVEANLQPKQSLQNQQSVASEGRMQQQRKTPKKQRGDFKLVQKQELLQKMVEVKVRMERNKLKQCKSESLLPLNVRNVISRDAKTLQVHNNQMDEWTFLNNQVAANCERLPQDTIFSRSDQFREKMHKIQALESVKSDEEKFNERQWYMRLRCLDHKDSRPPFTLITTCKPHSTPYQTRLVNRYVKDYEAERLGQQQNYILSDIYSNFGTKIIDNPYSQVETVVTEGKSPTNLFSSSFLPLFDQKLSHRAKKKFVDAKQFLCVEGTSQFQRELEFLKQDGQNIEAQYQQYEFAVEEPSTVAQKWDIKKLAKSGEHFYPSLNI